MNATSITSAVPFDDGTVAVNATSCFDVAISRTSDARIAPANWEIQYPKRSVIVSRRSRNSPSETAGLK